MKKVVVLLSSYNGEKYIEEQIESIFSQTYSNIELVVRDDGSTDNTCAILEKYEKERGIKFIRGKNVGFIKSFLSLIKQAPPADYYAFSDQDDVWMPEKIGYAVEELEKADNSKPVLYFSNYDFYDGNMNYIGHGKDLKRGPSFRNSLVDCISLGINSVMNKTAKDIICKDIPKHCCGHDWWTYMVCAGLGEVIYDHRYTVKYRRTGENVSPGGKEFIKMQLWRIKKFFVNNYFNNVHKMLLEYNRLYGSSLSADDRKVLSMFVYNKYNFKKAVKKTFYPKFFRQGIADELMLRAIFLIGKL